MNVANLTSNTELLRFVFDTAPLAMLVLNGTGRVVMANQRFSDLSGHSLEALANFPIEGLVDMKAPAASGGDRDSLMRAFRSRKTGIGHDVSLQHRDGTRVPVLIEVSTTRSADDDTFTCVFTDRSIADAEALRTTRKIRELEARNADLSRFAYGASHDLKAPMASMLGFLSFCLEDLEDGALDDLRENLEQMLELGTEGSKRIDAVFQVARVGEITHPVEEIPLEGMIREVWAEQSIDHDGRADLLLEADHVKPVRLERQTMRLILENLISNAFRFRDTDKSSLIVKIQTQTKDGVLQITVADNGSGIPGDRHRDVFRMFQHIDSRSGNGLGLALTKRHVERINGRIGFRSIEGEGSEFTVELPLAPAALA